MPIRTLPFVTLGALLTLCVVVVFTANQVAALDASLAQSFGSRGSQMQEYVEEVTTQSGRTITVRTVRLDGETVQAWADRHDEAVREAQSR